MISEVNDRAGAHGGRVPEHALMPPSSDLLLSRRYSRLLWLSVLPLFLLTIGLGLYQFQAQKSAELAGLTRNVAEQATALGSLIKAADDHIERLRAQAEDLLAGQTPFQPSPLRSILRREQRPGATSTVDGLFLDDVVGTPFAAASGNVVAMPDALERRDAGDREIDMALTLFEQMRLAHRVTPFLRWSYYFSGREDMVTSYPFQPSRSVVEGTGFSDMPSVMSSWFGYDIFLDAKPARNPERQSYWTPVYLDAWGAGWMVSHGAPVYRGDHFAGIVGTDILVGFLDDFLARFRQPIGKVWVIDQTGALLADGEPTSREEATTTLERVLPKDLGVVDRRRLLDGAGTFQRVGDFHVLSRPVEHTPWTIVYAVSNNEIDGRIRSRFIPYAIILAGLIATFLVSHELERRYFIRPALTLVEHIQAESQDKPTPRLHVPEPWRPWFTATEAVFTAKRAYVAQLKTSEELFVAAAENLPDGLMIVDADDRIVFFNSCYPEHLAPGLRSVLALGKRFDDWIKEGQTLGPIYHPEMGADFQQRRLALRRQDRTDHEHRLVDGRWLRIRETRMPDGRRVLLSSDITVRKLADETLRDSEERFRTIANGVPVPVIIVAIDQPKVLFGNAQATRIFGLEAGAGSEQIAAVWLDLDERQRMLDAIVQFGQVDGFETELRHADGSTFTALISARMLQYNGAPAVMAALADISEQRRLTEALRESEARFAAFMDHAPVGMYVKDLEGRYVMANPEMAKVFGRPVADVLGKPAAGLFAPEEVAAIAAYDAEVLRTGSAMVRQEHLAGLGDYEWSLVIRFPIQDERGQITNIAGFDVDISGQKRAEQKLVEQQEAVHQSEKMAALGSLLTGVAHELNNPLSIVAGYATMLRDFSSDDATREKAERIHIAAERCAKIVRNFLAIARSQPRELGMVDINAALGAALEMLSYGLRSADVTVEPNLAVGLPAVFGDDDQLHQVFANLIINAQQAMQQAAPPRRLQLRTYGRPGQVVVEVADSGPGIPSAIRSRIFDPFFTTKPAGVGTGVGLSVSRGIVVAHGGTIEVLPGVGGGASFRIVLPAVDQAAVAEDHAGVSSGAGLSGRILVIDDEPEICRLLSESLSRAGYAVEVAGSGRAGLALLGQRDFDLIISDLRMPDLDGPGLHRHLREYRPELLRRLVFITGDVLSADMDGAIAEDGIMVFEKPLDLAAMCQRIGDLLSLGDER